MEKQFKIMRGSVNVVETLTILITFISFIIFLIILKDRYIPLLVNYISSFSSKYIGRKVMVDIASTTFSPYKSEIWTHLPLEEGLKYSVADSGKGWFKLKMEYSSPMFPSRGDEYEVDHMIREEIGKGEDIKGFHVINNQGYYRLETIKGD